MALGARTPVKITRGIQSLMSDSVADDSPMSEGIASSHALESMLTEAKNTLDLSEGDYTMFVADQPNTPPSLPPVVLIAQASQGANKSASRPHVLGVCQLVNLNTLPQADLFPVTNANMYFNKYDAAIKTETAEVGVVKQPMHGSVEPNPGLADAIYVPNSGYKGKDSFALQVRGNGYTVTVHYFVGITDDMGTTTNDDEACKGQVWKISTVSTDANSGDLATWQRASGLYALLADASRDFMAATHSPRYE